MTSYEVPDGPKMLRETLCVAQVQLTLGRRHDGQIMAVRLPRESAQRLARAILAGPELAGEPS